jgi:hypothetical protein
VAAGRRIEWVEPNTTVGGLVVDLLGPAPRAELLQVLMRPDFERRTGLDATGIRESHLNRSPGGQ